MSDMKQTATRQTAETTIHERKKLSIENCVYHSGRHHFIASHPPTEPTNGIHRKSYHEDNDDNDDDGRDVLHTNNVVYTSLQALDSRKGEMSLLCRDI